MRLGLGFGIALGLGFVLMGAPPALARRDCARSAEVRVEPRTALRRGPGLNYPVEHFLVRPRCMIPQELSLDERWVLVKDDRRLGWVTRGDIDPRWRARLPPRAKARTAPVGSGQSRGTLRASRTLPLHDGPSTERRILRKLVAGSGLVGLSITQDEAWLEVRSAGGQVGWVERRLVDDPQGLIASLPRGPLGLEGPVDRQESGALVTEAPTGSAGASLHEPSPSSFALEARALLLGSVPAHRLKSNGEDPVRRYAIDAFAAGARLELDARPSQRWLARISYSLSLLPSLSPAGRDDLGISGRDHELRLLAGLPIELEGTALTLELGYAFVDFNIDPALPGAEVGQFFSYRSHAGTVGAEAHLLFGDGFGLDLAVTGLVGVAEEYPFDLGEAGLALGGFLSLRFQVELAESIELLLGYEARYRTTRFRGASFTDPSIDEASLTDLTQGLVLGLGFGA